MSLAADALVDGACVICLAGVCYMSSAQLRKARDSFGTDSDTLQVWLSSPAAPALM